MSERSAVGGFDRLNVCQKWANQYPCPERAERVEGIRFGIYGRKFGKM